MTSCRFPLLMAVVALAGCASVVPVPTTVATPGMPNPEEALKQSMQHVDAEMAQLGQMSSATVQVAQQAAIPEDLQRSVTFLLEWAAGWRCRKAGCQYWIHVLHDGPIIAAGTQRCDPDFIGPGFPRLPGARRRSRDPGDRAGRSATSPGAGHSSCLARR